MINEKNGNQIIYGLYGINQSKYEKKKNDYKLRLN